MNSRPLKIGRCVPALIAAAILALTTACASGGFKLTREYAGWVNSQPTILRVILYLLTGVVFVITILVDVVVNNTMDFWDGKVSAGEYEFQKDGKTYLAHHEVNESTHLRRSTIRVLGADRSLLQEVSLVEMPSGQIEMRVDGKLRARVDGLNEMPIASVFGSDGRLVSSQAILARGIAAAK